MVGVIFSYASLALINKKSKRWLGLTVKPLRAYRRRIEPRENRGRSPLGFFLPDRGPGRIQPARLAGERALEIIHGDGARKKFNRSD
jgi:hypothetical protein